jgi:hypothetical protein
MANLTKYNKINGREIFLATTSNIKDLTNQKLWIAVPTLILIYNSLKNLLPTLLIKPKKNLKSKNRRAVLINRQNLTMQF